MSSREFFPALFSRHAVAYRDRVDEIMGRGEARGRLAALEWVKAGPGMRILDLACGPGHLSLLLAQAVSPDGEVVGVDLAPGMLELARTAAYEAGSAARFELMDIGALEFSDAEFDGALCGHGLQFLPDLDAGLREIRRVLKPGARLGASVPADGGLSPAFRILDDIVTARLGRPESPGDREATVRIVGAVDSFAEAARRAGFSEARAEAVEEEMLWGGPAALVERATSWWSLAVRLETLPGTEVDALKAEAVAAIESKLGPGPITTGGRTLVLMARA